MKVRIPRNQEENNEQEQTNEEGRRVVSVTPKVNLIITQHDLKNPEEKKSKRGLKYTPNAVTQQHAMNLRVDEIFYGELKKRGTDKRADILFELTNKKFLEIFTPASIRKFVAVAVSNRLKKDVKDFIQFVIDKKTENLELSEEEVLKELLRDIDNWTAGCYKVDSSNNNDKEVEAFIERMKGYAKETLEKMLKKFEIVEPKPQKAKIADKLQTETTLPKAEEVILEEPIIEEDESENTTEQNETNVGEFTNTEQQTAGDEETKKDAIIERALEEVSIKKSYKSGTVEKETYYQEVLRFTDEFSFFCKDSIVYAGETGHREKFKNLDNYAKFCALREQVKNTMRQNDVSEGIAMTLLLNDPKVNLDSQDREILAIVSEKLRIIEEKSAKEEKFKRKSYILEDME